MPIGFSYGWLILLSQQKFLQLVPHPITAKALSGTKEFIRNSNHCHLGYLGYLLRNMLGVVQHATYFMKKCIRQPSVLVFCDGNM